ncbi:hypothetical protein [Streptomyces fragilis]|uniref:Uncharacterized protein n=1 Tax=Streptomyces fragilis TaxID=67301 RepID=A0ABV2YDP3_9ACTN|nr:hypothetical protein [Streptomyces fragilis]
MSQPSASSSKTTTVPADKAPPVPQPVPFLLTARQGEAARTLLRYVSALPLPGPDAQLLAVVAAIRSARGGTGHITGMDLATLRLGDAPAAVDALRALGWELDDAVFDNDPAAPAGTVVIPEMSRTAPDHPLPFGKDKRSRVSGWTSRTLSAKPVKKLPPAGRLAALFLAAHGDPELPVAVPPHLPAACRPFLLELLDRGFLAELPDGQYLLDPRVRHLCGLRPYEEEESKDPTKARGYLFTEEAWEAWKDAGTPALRRHVESVEGCARCALRRERVAEAFMVPAEPVVFRHGIEALYGKWKEARPDRGREAAEFTVAFRAEHGHGPSFKQMFTGLGWDVPKRPQLRAFVVGRLTSHGWLTTTGQVPWTLRPGPAAQEQGIVLPRARTSPPAGAHVGVTSP